MLFSPLLFEDVTLKYALRRVQANKDGLKLSDALQFVVYADDVNVVNTLSESIGTIKIKQKFR
jgi:hypothetical protein